MKTPAKFIALLLFHPKLLISSQKKSLPQKTKEQWVLLKPTAHDSRYICFRMDQRRLRRSNNRALNPPSNETEVSGTAV